MVRARWALVGMSVVVASLGLTGCPGPMTVTDAGTVVVVVPGDEFRVGVPENASIGDDWEVRTPPDPAVAVVTGETYEAEGDPDADGGGGTRYVELRAEGPGTTEIELFNCYRCGGSGEPEPDSGRPETATFTITVG